MDSLVRSSILFESHCIKNNNETERKTREGIS